LVNQTNRKEPRRKRKEKKREEKKSRYTITKDTPALRGREEKPERTKTQSARIQPE
jgi:hypothetical protein